jgi:transcription elongation factor GreA
MDNVVALTKEGFEALQAKLKHLKEVERPRVIKAIADARALGDLSENAEYHAAKERQGFLEAEIGKIEEILARAQVADTRRFNDCKVRFGAWVTLFDEDKKEEVRYHIVGEPEADIDNGKISVTSPLARALIGKEEGDEVTFKAPMGTRHFTIVSVEYK